jgi:hypothetical protein
MCRPGQRVCLTEHFRCAEPIINYSNQMFYSGKLVKTLTVVVGMLVGLLREGLVAFSLWQAPC